MLQEDLHHQDKEHLASAVAALKGRHRRDGTTYFPLADCSQSSSCSSTSKSPTGSSKSSLSSVGSSASSACRAAQVRAKCHCWKEPAGCSCCSCKELQAKQTKGSPRQHSCCQQHRCPSAASAANQSGAGSTSSSSSKISESLSAADAADEFIKIVIVNAASGAELAGSAGGRKKYHDRVACDEPERCDLSGEQRPQQIKSSPSSSAKMLAKQLPGACGASADTQSAANRSQASGGQAAQEKSQAVHEPTCCLHGKAPARESRSLGRCGHDGGGCAVISAPCCSQADNHNNNHNDTSNSKCSVNNRNNIKTTAGYPTCPAKLAGCESPARILKQVSADEQSAQPGKRSQRVELWAKGAPINGNGGGSGGVDRENCVNLAGNPKLAKDWSGSAATSNADDCDYQTIVDASDEASEASNEARLVDGSLLSHLSSGTEENIYQQLEAPCGSPQHRNHHLNLQHQHHQRAFNLNKRLVSRSGSQCSSVSSFSTTCSSVSSSSMSSGASERSNYSAAMLASHFGRARSSHPGILEDEGEGKARLLTSAGSLKVDENNNVVASDDDASGAYKTFSEGASSPASAGKTAAKSVPPPPPPPPPPLVGFNPLGSLLSAVADLQQSVKSHQLKQVQLRGQDEAQAAPGAPAAKTKRNQLLMHGAAMPPAFIPPQFSAPPEDGTNIKPSEYLKRMSSSSALSSNSSSATANSSGTAGTSDGGGANNGELSNTSTPVGSLSSSTGASLISGSSAGVRRFERAKHHIAANRFKPPNQVRQLGELARSQSTSALGRICSDTDSVSNYSTDGSSQGDEGCEETLTQRDKFNANLMSAIRKRAHLFKVQSSSTKIGENASADDTDVCKDSNNNVPQQTVKEDQRLDSMFAATKRDLIAELKESTGLNGINKMKENCRNKGEVKRIVASMVPDFKAEDFMDKVAESEPGAPLWRIQMLAKKAAEKARKDCEEKCKLELEAHRLSQVPAWKRQMLAKKAAERCRRDDLDKVRREMEEKRLSEMPVWKRQLARIKMTASIGNVSTIGQ